MITCVKSITLLCRLKVQSLYQLVPVLLKSGKGAGTEEDNGVPEPVPLAVEPDLVHQGIGRNLVVGRAVHFSSGQDGIPETFQLSQLHIVNEIW